MKITRLKLTNFIGIKNGTDLDEIEIDFNTDKRLILLLGRNGSGKSTIMSCLTPYSETFDKRKVLNVEGKVATKEIDILNGDYLYKITHQFYPKKNKSFIKKIDLNTNVEEELNPQGNVSSFPAIIEEELGVKKNYFLLSRIGSQASNFIDLGTSDRKKFIGTLTPNIDQYLDALKPVNEKLSELNKEFKFCSSELGNYDESKLLSDSNIYAKQLNTLNATYNEKQEDVKNLRSAIYAYEENSNEYDFFIKHYLDRHNRLLVIEERLSHIKSTYPEEELRDITNSDDNDFVRLNDELISKIESHNAIELEYRKLKDRGLTLEGEKRGLSEENANRVKIKNLLEEQESNLKELNDEIAKLRAKIPEGVALSHLSQYVFIFYNKLDDVLKRCRNVLERYSCERWSDVHSSRNKYIEDCENLLFKLRKELEVYETIEINRQLINELIELHKTCNCDKDCKLHHKVASFIDFSNESSINDKIKELKEEIKRIESSINDNEYQECSKKINELNSADLEILKILPLISGFENIDNVIFELYDIPDRYFTTKLEKIHDTLKEISLKEQEMNKLSDAIEFTKDKLISSKDIPERLAKCEVELEEAIDKFNEFKAKFKESEQSIQVLRTNIEIKKKHLEVKKQIKDLSNEIESANRWLESNRNEFVEKQKILELYESNKESLKQAKEKLKAISVDIEKVQNELAKCEAGLLLIKRFNTRISEISGEKEKLEVVKNALDIKTGIPLVLVGDYLQDIKNNANALLRMAFGNKFYIDFNISDSEFSIPVFNEGVEVASDVTLCSQGEVSLVKTSLSLAIIIRAIQLSPKKYNIVCLDEIDSELDKDNRAIFIDIMNKQLDKLGAEQCFIITHNDNFDLHPAGVVLLQGNTMETNDDLLKNKEILFKV